MTQRQTSPTVSTERKGLTVSIHESQRKGARTSENALRYGAWSTFNTGVSASSHSSIEVPFGEIRILKYQDSVSEDEHCFVKGYN